MRKVQTSDPSDDFKQCTFQKLALSMGLWRRKVTARKSRDNQSKTPETRVSLWEFQPHKPATEPNDPTPPTNLTSFKQLRSIQQVVGYIQYYTLIAMPPTTDAFGRNLARGRERSRSRSRDRYDDEQEHVYSKPTTAPSTTLSSMYNPNQSNALSSILLAQKSAQDKVNRELFVGNTPPGTSEMLLLQFLNGAMRRIKLCPENYSPILNCRVNAKFAFVECQTLDDAHKVLCLNGIPFLNTNLKVSRPSKYTGPIVPTKTWQELTGQAPIMGDSSLGLSSAEEKLTRELFIGNTTPEMTEQMIRDFLGKAMEQVGLTSAPGNPIVTCRVSGKFAFVELRTREEAERMLNMNGIPFLGAALKIGRPSKYTGPVTTHGCWEDILAKYMTGELKPKVNSNPPVNHVTQTQPASRVVMLKNMLTHADLQEDKEYEEILEDTREECSQFGALKSIVLPRSGTGATKVFLEYLTSEDAGKAIRALAGRTFDGRKVEAVSFSEEKFKLKDYSD